MNGIIAGVQEIKKARNGVAVLMKNERDSAVIGFRSVSSRMIWAKLRFSSVKVCVVAVYGPTEGEVEESERFWNDLDRVVYRVGRV